MPRRPRRDRDGDAHHVVLRGHSGSPIIRTVEDAKLLLAGLGAKLREHDVAAWSWALVTNHGHLELVGAIERISAAVRDGVASYARHMNAVTGKHGSFFQDRFYSKPIGDDEYGATASVYILRNAYTAGHVRSAAALEQHPLCAAAALLDDAAPQLIPMDVEGALRLFDPDPHVARRSLRERLASSIADWERDRRAGTAEGVLRTVAGERGIPPEILREKSRHSWITDARLEIVRRCVALGLSRSEIATALGVTRQAVVQVIKKLTGAPPLDLDDGWRLRFD